MKDEDKKAMDIQAPVFGTITKSVLTFAQAVEFYRLQGFKPARGLLNTDLGIEKNYDAQDVIDAINERRPLKDPIK